MNIDDQHRSTCDQSATDRPQGLFTHFAKISNGHNSATGHPIHFMFPSRVWFWGTADRTVLFLVWANPRWRSAAISKSSVLHISVVWQIMEE